MDRNTLLAFLLISLVLIFTPKYIEMVSPARSTQLEEPEEPSTYSINDTLDNLGYQKSTHRKQNTLNLKLGEQDRLEETITKVENDLYKALISSLGGGTIKSFEVKNYYIEDSLPVNLINSFDPRSLSLGVENLDGEAINLSGSWEIENTYIPDYLDTDLTLVFSTTLYGERIEKTLTFSPESFLIDISFNLGKSKNNVFRDLEFGWYGGLASTEKDVVSDQAYFKSYLYQGGELESQKVKEGEKEESVFNGPADWAAVRTKYFISALMPSDINIIEKSILSSSYDLYETYNMAFVVESGRPTSFSLFLGPLEYGLIKDLSVNLDMVMDFGWSPIRPISKGVLFTLTELHRYIPNYGFVLILFSFLVKLVVYPLTKKSYQSTAAMQTIQPEITSLREKYKNNPQKLNQATMKLYKEKGVNPLGGCLPMLLQMPLLLALFQVFRSTIELRSEPFIWWIKDLSAPDTVLNLPFNVPIYGDQVSVLPVLMVLSMFIQQRMMSPGAQQPQQKTMQYFMTGFFFLMFNSFPSGLNLYYTLFNVLTILQQKLVPTTPNNKTQKR
tara:strand:- start:2371 stop:4044 length:1674 start_codon:yes stop_codon:yes gene_type:complete